MKLHLAAAVGAVFIFSGHPSWAGFTEGSTATSRSSVDAAVGQVFIYNGGFFDLGSSEQVTTFTWFGHQFSGSRFMTPILFHELPIGVITVVGIGTGRTVTSSTSPQNFAFGLTQGTDTTANGGLWEFGYVNGLVDSNGNQTSSSAGTVDVVSPKDPGAGIDILSSNDWLFTSGPTTPKIALGTTFFTPGSSGTYALNDPSKGQANRTYSANLTGLDATATVPEPGTFTLFAAAGLLLAGVLRFRKSALASILTS